MKKVDIKGSLNVEDIKVGLLLKPNYKKETGTIAEESVTIYEPEVFNELPKGDMFAISCSWFIKETGQSNVGSCYLNEAGAFTLTDIGTTSSIVIRGNVIRADNVTTFDGRSNFYPLPVGNLSIAGNTLYYNSYGAYITDERQIEIEEEENQQNR